MGLPCSTRRQSQNSVKSLLPISCPTYALHIHKKRRNTGSTDYCGGQEAALGVLWLSWAFVFPKGSSGQCQQRTTSSRGLISSLGHISGPAYQPHPLISSRISQSILLFCPVYLFHRSLLPTALRLGNGVPHTPQTHFSSKCCISQSYTDYFSYCS